MISASMLEGWVLRMGKREIFEHKLHSMWRTLEEVVLEKEVLIFSTLNKSHIFL